MYFVCFVILFSSNFLYLHSQNNDFWCSEQFPIITDLGPSDCNSTNNYYFVEGGSDNGCFPSCVLIDNRPGLDFCDVYANDCPPGYYCDGGRNLCLLDENSCDKYYVADSTVDYTQAMWKPACLTDGTWSPRQCKGEAAHGRCFCFDAVGNRLFGQAFTNEAVNMTCACSRRRAELEAAGDRFFVGLHCDSVGNYEPLQCDSEQCWCVEPKTGKVTAPVVPESLMSYLPCYDVLQVGEQYLRQCESQFYAQEKIRNEFSIHGTTRTNFPTLLCDPDGSYGAYRITNAIAYCTWRDNTAIGSYQTPTSSGISNINCNCARDIKIFELYGQTQPLQCLFNGNYETLQQDGNMFYCVDGDGFAKSGEFSDPSVVNCDSFR